jgi:methylated-DNA-[protein]-cysteine S-methyltransferase
VLRRHPDAMEGVPPAPIQAAIDATTALLAGEPRDLVGIVVELDHLPEFDRRVLDVTRAIPPGSTLTYGQVAARVGEPGAAQAVGKALGRNPIPVIVPCHRVLAAGGKLKGFSAPGGVLTKRRLLEIENAHTGDEPDLFDLAR